MLLDSVCGEQEADNNSFRAVPL